MSDGIRMELGAGWSEIEGAFGDVLESLEAQDRFDVLNAGAQVVKSRAVELVPVDKGELRDTIDVVEDDNTPVVVAGTDHAEPIEYGTSQMAAQPFMRPAMDDTAPILEAISAELAAKLKRAERRV